MPLRRDATGRQVHDAFADPRPDKVSSLSSIGGAPVGSTYVTISNDGTLTAERALAVGAEMNLADGGANSSVTLSVPGAALTRVDDTNVTLTLGGTPATALVRAASLTLGWTGQLAISRGGTSASTALGAFNALSPLTTRGDLLTRDASNNIRLAIGAANRFLGSDGTDPAWTAPGALTRVDDTNVTLTLGGSPTTALLRAASLTLGWTGQLAISRGGTGQSTATAAFDALAPTTTTGDLIYYNGTDNIRLAVGGANTVLGVSAGAPAWQAQSYIDHGSLGGLTDDDHAGYTRIAGRAGTTNDTTLSTSAAGTLYGSSASGQDGNWQSTSHSTRGLCNIVDEGRIRTGLTSVSGFVTTVYGMRQVFATALAGTVNTLVCLGATGTVDDQSGNIVNLFRNNATLSRSTAGGGGANSSVLLNDPTINSNNISTTGGALVCVNHTPTYSVTGAVTLSGLDTGLQCSGAVGSGCTLTVRRGLYFRDVSGSGDVTEACAVDVDALADRVSGAGTSTNIAVRSAIVAATNNYFLRDTGGAQSYMVGKFTTYNNKTTAGFGLATIVAVGRSTGQTAAVASVATVTPSADGTFRVSANVRPTTSTTHTFTVTVTYTDEGGTSRTLTLNFFTVAAGVTVTSSIANAAGAVPYHGIPVHIRAQSGGAITVATTGTFTTVTYNVEAVIEQLA